MKMGGNILCEKCAAKQRHRNEVYMWISPSRVVTGTKEQTKLTDEESDDETTQ